MNVLGFDTSTKILSIALDTEDSHFEFSCSLGFKHSELLVGEIENFLKRAEISLSELDLIVCSKGPGSFTGLRIGMSTAKGLSMGSGVPMVTIDTLDMMAYGLDFFDGIVMPVIDARKKRFYTALFNKNKKISENLDLTPSDIFNKIKNYRRVLITGSDVEEFRILMDSPNNIIFDKVNKKPWAANLIELGMKKFEKSGASPDNEGPLYLRRSEAEIGITRKP